MNYENSGGLISSLVLWQAFQSYALEIEKERSEAKEVARGRSIWTRLRQSIGNGLNSAGDGLQPRKSATNQA